MNTTPTKRLVEHAIESARNGSVRQYLTESAASTKAVNERTLRNGFGDLRYAALQSDSTAQARVLIRNLNGYYRTRYSLRKLEILLPAIYRAISSRGWWNEPPVPIADASASDVANLESLVRAVLDDAERSGLDRPYSLVTKFLHFCFPESFGIYDAQAANSIQAWGYFTFELGDTKGEPFSLGNMADTSGRGYGAVIDFYKSCFDQIPREQIGRLDKAAKDLTEEVGAPVSSVYLIDNLLWHANGDPRKLGLL